jgi:hypothetical protein
MRVSCGFLVIGLSGKTRTQIFPPLDEARHRHARRFNLAIGQPARLERLQPVVSKRDVGAAPRLAGHAPALLLSVLDLLRHQHGE